MMFSKFSLCPSLCATLWKDGLRTAIPKAIKNCCSSSSDGAGFFGVSSLFIKKKVLVLKNSLNQHREADHKTRRSPKTVIRNEAKGIFPDVLTTPHFNLTYIYRWKMKHLKMIENIILLKTASKWNKTQT